MTDSRTDRLEAARPMIECRDVHKYYGDYHALRGIDLTIRAGEFFSLLGPSGCGKTTLLRTIAGFEDISSGVVLIDGKDMAGVGANHRPTNMVFQSYAIFPHLSVAENVGFGLRRDPRSKEEKARAVEEALSIVGLKGYGQRAAHALSGGQRQRVALARCLVATPSLVLFDEPLANLDVHLRASMENEFADFHKRTGTTIVYITHDQAEAMALADRIAVMDRGRLIQFATPQELYARPCNAMVAHFIANGIVLPADVIGAEQAGKVRVRVLGEEVLMNCAPGTKPRHGAEVCLRSADLNVSATGGVGVHVKRAVYRGGGSRIEAHPVGRPDLELGFDLADPVTLAEGSAAHLTFTGGWVIPAEGME